MKKFLSLIGLLAMLAAFTGCKSFTPADSARIASVSKQAATIGTREVLTAHPSYRAEFQEAADELHALASSPTIGVSDLLAIAQRLPVKELKSDTARLSFEGATLFISAIDVPELSADRVAQLQPIAQAIADGIIAGMPSVPAPTP